MSPQTKRQHITNWHEWFAWHPVRVGEYVYWLERVQRIVKFEQGCVDEYLATEYKTYEYKTSETVA